MVARFSDGKAVMNVSVELNDHQQDYIHLFIQNSDDWQTAESIELSVEDWHKLVKFINSELDTEIL